MALALGTCLLAAPAWAADESARAAAGGAAAAEQLGQTIRITLPLLDEEAVKRVKGAVGQALEKARAQGARAVLIFEFDVPPGAAPGGRGSDFGLAYDLAKFLSGKDLNAATTVAYLPQSIQGHAVLVALACDEIIMAKKAETIGAAGVDEEVVGETHVSAYREIAGRRRTLPVELALGMLRPADDVLMVQTETGTEYVTAAGLEELRKHHAIRSQKLLIPKGQPWKPTGAELRALGFVMRLAADRRDVADALGLRPQSVGEDPLQGDKWRAVRVDLRGPLEAEKVDQAERLIQEQVHLHKKNFICLWIDSAGGPPDECLRLADFLAFDVDPAAVRTVAYIPGKALAQAALVAMACDEIVLHPDAELGGPGSPQMSRNEIEAAKPKVKRLAARKMRSWSLWAAMIDPQVEVFRCTRLGQVEFFSEEERAAAQPKPEAGDKGPPWQEGQCVSTPPAAFAANGAEAVDFRLANHTAENFAQFRRLYDLGEDPTLVEPGWADLLIDYLRGPSVSALLLVIGAVALYLELHAPGLGLGGFVGAVCFLLFFWSHYLPSTAFWLEITLFVAGIAGVLTEVFLVPGTVIFGLGGSAMVLASLVLAGQTFVVPHNSYELAVLQRSLLTVASAAAGTIVAAMVLRRWVPRAPVLRHVFLEPPAGEEARTISRRESLVKLENLLGAEGVTTTQLTPGGKARFGSTLVDVVAVGELVPRDTPVIVTEVRGNHVVVKPADSE
jgi:membrane-bound ClpP family serine protease